MTAAAGHDWWRETMYSIVAFVRMAWNPPDHPAVEEAIRAADETVKSSDEVVRQTRKLHQSDAFGSMVRGMRGESARGGTTTKRTRRK